MFSAVCKKAIKTGSSIRSENPEKEISISVVYSNVRIRGKPTNLKKNNKFQKKTGDLRKQPNLFEPRKVITDKKELAMIYLKKWRSKTIYQVLLEYRAEMFREFSNFSQQVHLYNQQVNYLMTSKKRRGTVPIQEIDSKQTYKKFIGAPKPIVLRIPFNSRHKSMYVSDLDFDPYASKSVLHGEQKNRDAPSELSKKNKALHFVTKRILDVRDVGIQVNLKSGNVDDEEEDEDYAYFYHYETGEVAKECKYVGRHLGKSMSVASVENVSFERMEGVETDYSVPTSSFGKVFMQLMCPSCCGGLLSETKGSVYTKRASKTKSVASSVSDITIEDYEENKDMYATIRTLTPIPEDHDKPQSPTSIAESEGKSREQRSVSLGDALCQELNQNKTDDGKIDWNTKLRKISIPTVKSEQNKLKENTVIELKIRGKEHVEVVKQNGSEDAPFNFQAILRKTSTTRSSLIRKVDKKRDNYFKAELLPGVILQGEIYDL